MHETDVHANRCCSDTFLKSPEKFRGKNCALHFRSSVLKLTVHLLVRILSNASMLRDVS